MLCDLQGLLAQYSHGNYLPSCPELLQDSILEYKYLHTIKTRGIDPLGQWVQMSENIQHTFIIMEKSFGSIYNIVFNG